MLDAGCWWTRGILQKCSSEPVHPVMLEDIPDWEEAADLAHRL
jgi:hypothetical protein